MPSGRGILHTYRKRCVPEGLTRDQSRKPSWMSLSGIVIISAIGECALRQNDTTTVLSFHIKEVVIHKMRVEGGWHALRVMGFEQSVPEVTGHDYNTPSTITIYTNILKSPCFDVSEGGGEGGKFPPLAY